MTSHPAITISRSLGSGGTEVGFLVARRLGWHFCDRRILRLAAGAMGHSVASLAHQEDHPCGFKDWLMTIFALGSPEAPFTLLKEVPIYSRDLFDVQRAVMQRMVEHAPSVIVGRGGFIALKDRPDALHVSLHADLEFRIESLMRRHKVADRRAALAAIEDSDRGRAGFIRAISGADWRDPRHFDLVLDPSALGPEACVEAIVKEAGLRFGLGREA
ncbi:cytidylate kinase-like family protein [Mesoterricola silvestris]|uniref:Cytidylate kinase n=1 Tax=Mesoterricola silvestris TaxID=2927979 RepID=A0AA48K830_9BACT|nr:cytidylate kinase-like family protein [Mesoterricola silvestris]BDU71705.1 cytidylate kinase [Mesoterricola silvestris]